MLLYWHFNEQKVSFVPKFKMTLAGLKYISTRLKELVYLSSPLWKIRIFHGKSEFFMENQKLKIQRVFSDFHRRSVGLSLKLAHCSWGGRWPNIRYLSHEITHNECIKYFCFITEVKSAIELFYLKKNEVNRGRLQEAGITRYLLVRIRFKGITGKFMDKRLNTPIPDPCFHKIVIFLSVGNSPWAT